MNLRNIWKWLVSMIIHSGKQYPFRTLGKKNIEPSTETRKVSIIVWKPLKSQGHLHIMQGFSSKGQQLGIANFVLRWISCVMSWVWQAHSGMWTCGIALREASWSDSCCQEEFMLLRIIVPF